MSDERLIDEIRRKMPGIAARADAGSVLAATYLGCLECCGGSRNEVVLCVSPHCPWFPYRLGRNTRRARPQMTEERRQAAAEQLRALHAARAAKAGGNDLVPGAGALIRAEREEAGMTLGQLAEALGLSVVELSDHELGNTMMTAALAGTAAEALAAWVAAQDGEEG